MVGLVWLGFLLEIIIRKSRFEEKLDLLKRLKTSSVCLSLKCRQKKRWGRGLKHLNNSNICVLWLFPLFETVSYVSQTGRKITM